jgi:SOS-response transcriptional repressor LexA
MTTFQQRLAEAMALRKMSQRALAQAAGMRQQSVWYLLNPTKSDTPQSKFLNKIAYALNVDPVWLETGSGEMQGPKMVTAGGARIGRRIPLFNERDLIQIKEASSSDEITTECLDEGAFAVRAWDHSMEPDVMVGDTLIVSPGLRPAPTDLLIANCDGTVVLRKLRILTAGKTPHIQLLSSNPDHPSYDSAESKCNLIGVVVETRRARRSS